MEDWLRLLAGTLGVDPLDDDQIETILSAARDVAHRVERRATPLAAFLLGAAVQRRIGHGVIPPDALADALVDLQSVLPPSPEGPVGASG